MRQNGYTLVEVLTVVGIIGIMASLSGPMYAQHVQRARASEAVAVMALARQSERDYRITNHTYYDVGGGNILNALPESVTSGIPTPNDAGVDVDAGVSQYFSNQAFSVDATSPSSARFTNPGVVDFLIIVDGVASVKCSDLITTNCAIQADKAVNVDMEMDNSGRIFVSNDNGTTWRAY